MLVINTHSEAFRAICANFHQKISALVLVCVFSVVLVAFATAAYADETYLSGSDLSDSPDTALEEGALPEAMSFTPSNSGFPLDMPEAISSIKGFIASPSLKLKKWEWNVPELQSAFNSVFTKGLVNFREGFVLGT